MVNYRVGLLVNKNIAARKTLQLIPQHQGSFPLTFFIAGGVQFVDGGRPRKVRFHGRPFDSVGAANYLGFIADRKDRMVKKKKQRTVLPATGLDRRDFLATGLAAMASVMLFGTPALAGQLRVTVSPEKSKSKTAGSIHKSDPANWKPVAALAQPFMNEKIKFDISFMTAKAAQGQISFKRTADCTFTASMEATTTGLAASVVKYRKQVMTSTFCATQTPQGMRFVTSGFYTKLITTKGTSESRHYFNYKSRRWIKTRVKNGKRKKRKIRRIPPNVYYDDIVNLFYNMRAGAYGKIEEGKLFRLQTMPWGRTIKKSGKKKRVTSDRLDVFVAKTSELSNNDKSWMKKIGASHLFIVKFDKDVYGIKSGEAKLYADKKMKPRGAKVKDALFFGDVNATLKK